jgi:serine/threonine protein kinase
MTTASIGSLLDHYKIIEELGHGGMGVVYKALNIHLDKIVAIKTIALGLSSHENFINRFQTEARALAKLEDPNIVRIYDLRVDDDQWYIVMEYVEGGTLADRIRGDKAIPYLSALPIMKQLLNAVGHAHRVGIIHRDIKPNNVMITRDGIVKITDFGLAKDQHHNNNTLAGSTGGTLYYMSPEQVKGLFYTDHRSDIYSLGLTFYEMLAGKIPFRKDDTDFAIREAIIKRRFPPPSHFNPLIPVALNSIVMRAIEKNPDQRYQGVNEMLESIIKFEKHQTFWAPATPKQKYDPNALDDTSRIILPPDTGQISYEENVTRRKTTKKILKWASIAVLLPVLVWFAYANYYADRSSEIEKAQAVTIRSNPDAALVIANGDTLGRTPLFHARLFPGTMNFMITKDSFIPLDTILRIDPKNSSELVFNLHTNLPDESHIIQKTGDMLTERSPVEKEPGRLAVITEPAGVSIYRDGRLIGQSPLSGAEIEAGNYVFQFKKEGYATQTQRVNITPGRFTNLNIVLSQITSELTVKTEPAGAEIEIDGTPLAENATPAVIKDLAVGAHHVVLKKEGYLSYQADIEIGTDKPNLLSAVLTQATGEIQLLVKPWGTIYIDKQIKKENTNVAYTEVLSSGEHLIIITHPTYGTWEKKINVSAGQTRDLVIDFTQRVNVRVTAFDTKGKPVWADILIDNKPTGNITPKEIAVRIGRRTFSVQKEGYELVGSSRDLMLDKNLEEPLKFIFRRRF